MNDVYSFLFAIGAVVLLIAEQVGVSRGNIVGVFLTVGLLTVLDKVWP